jgi:hypothetical protein
MCQLRKCYKDTAEVEIHPWRFLHGRDSKRIIPNNRFGKKILDSLYILEDKYPRFSIAVGRHPTIVLIKKG